MAYEAHFTSKFDQSKIINFAISQASKNADLAAARNGVCQMISLMWLGGVGGLGSDRSEVRDVVESSQGAAFWKQVVGGQMGMRTLWSDTSKADNLTTHFRLVTKDNTRSFTYDRSIADATALAQHIAGRGTYTCYLSLDLGDDGHGCALKVAHGTAYVFFDPNFGAAIDLLGLGSGLTSLLQDCKTHYKAKEFDTFILT